MTVKNLAPTLLGLTFASLFIFRDAVAAVFCKSYIEGCNAAAAPCPSSQSCASVSGGTPNNVDGTCDDGASSSYWTTTAPASWIDCIPRAGQGTCVRVSATCQVVYLYKGLLACERGAVPCASKTVSACKADGSGADCPL